jgi:hypothetical protein
MAVTPVPSSAGVDLLPSWMSTEDQLRHMIDLYNRLLKKHVEVEEEKNLYKAKCKAQQELANLSVPQKQEPPSQPEPVSYPLLCPDKDRPTVGTLFIHNDLSRRHKQFQHSRRLKFPWVDCVPLAADNKYVETGHTHGQICRICSAHGQLFS